MPRTRLQDPSTSRGVVPEFNKPHRLPRSLDPSGKGQFSYPRWHNGSVPNFNKRTGKAKVVNGETAAATIQRLKDSGYEGDDLRSQAINFGHSAASVSKILGAASSGAAKQLQFHVPTTNYPMLVPMQNYRALGKAKPKDNDGIVKFLQNKGIALPADWKPERNFKLHFPVRGPATIDNALDIRKDARPMLADAAAQLANRVTTGVTEAHTSPHLNEGAIGGFEGTLFESAMKGAFDVPAGGTSDRFDVGNYKASIDRYFSTGTFSAADFKGDNEGSEADKLRRNMSNKIWSEIEKNPSLFTVAPGLSKGLVPNFFKMKNKKYRDGLEQEITSHDKKGKRVGQLTYDETKSALELTYNASSVRGAGFKQFQGLMQESAATGKPITSGSLINQVAYLGTKLTTLSKLSPFEQMSRLAFPQLRHRQVPGAKTSGQGQFLLAEVGGKDQPTFEFKTLRDLKSKSNQWNKEVFARGLIKNAVSINHLKTTAGNKTGLFKRDDSKLLGRGIVPNFAKANPL